jgi:dipeptidyl aminopeptidase/acylaminoacyl peptidase
VLGPFVAIAFALAGAHAEAAARFTQGAMARLVELSAPQMAPNGARVALVASRADFANDRLLASLDVVDVASGARRTIVPARFGLSSPAWSPDGRRIAFLAPGASEAAQIFVVAAAGGSPHRVTRAPSGIEQFAWRPDGRAFAYVSTASPPVLRGAARFRDGFHVGTDSYLARAIPEPAHLFVARDDGTGVRQLTRGRWTVLDGEDQTALTWSADGATLAFARAPSAILNDQDGSAVWLCSVATGVLRKLTTHAAHETSPLFAPVGRRIAFLYATGGEEVAQSELYLAGPGAAVNLSHAYDRTLLDAAWMPSSTALLAAADDGERRSLVEFPLSGGLRRIDLHGLDLVTDAMLYNTGSSLRGSIAPDGTIAFIGASPHRPSELYVVRPSGAPRRLTSYNAFVASLDLPRVEPFWFNGPDGFREEAVLTYPVGYDPSHRYPLMLKIHGGPDLAARVTFDPLPQLMAARGWFVLAPNYRGSTNLGLAYQRAIARAPSSGPEKDLLAALALVQGRGLVDARRLGVSGWSYGGQLTAWMIAKHHAWCAAMTGAPVTDTVVDYATADDLNDYPPIYGGPPFQGDLRALYERESPLTYVKDVTTPLLIMHNVGDERVPIVNSYLLFRALRDLHRPVQFVAYPLDVHEAGDAGDPVRVADTFARWTGWFDAAFARCGR